MKTKNSNRRIIRDLYVLRIIPSTDLILKRWYIMILDTSLPMVYHLYPWCIIMYHLYPWLIGTNEDLEFKRQDYTFDWFEKAPQRMKTKNANGRIIPPANAIHQSCQIYVQFVSRLSMDWPNLGLIFLLVFLAFLLVFSMFLLVFLIFFSLYWSFWRV